MDIRALGYVTIETTDLEKWRQFGLQILGLMEVPGLSDPRQLYLKMDEYLYRLRIVQAARDRFVCAGWEVAGPREFEQALRELTAVGIAVERGSEQESSHRHVREFARFVDPAGHVGEIFYGLPLDYLPLQSPVGVRRFVTGYHGDMGLGHIAVPTPNLEASHRFYTQVMGFGQTDYMDVRTGPAAQDCHGLHFLHAQNPRHHSLALYEDSARHPGDLVHLMMEVEDLDALGQMLDRVHRHGVRTITCLGRHTNDRMVSVYVESPAGFALEYGFDGVQIDWRNYLPTESVRTSHWGHRWGQSF